MPQRGDVQVEDRGVAWRKKPEQIPIRSYEPMPVVVDSPKHGCNCHGQHGENQPRLRLRAQRIPIYTAANWDARDLDQSSIYGSNSCIMEANWSGLRDCAPSLKAFSGCGCTSTINASAPIATAALHKAGTRLRLPVAWLGSKTTGRCDSSFNTGMAVMSQVLRVAVSKVRIPRSHKMTF